MRRQGLAVAAVVAALLAARATVVRAEEIRGVQPAALDQPRVYVQVRRTEKGPALSAKGEGGEPASAVEAFLDTGASGVVLSSSTYKALGIRFARTPEGTAVKFEDVGVGGAEEFRVSEPVFLALAPYSSNTDGGDPGAYGKPLGPMRVQLRPTGGILDALTGGTDVVGMPAMAGKVVVIDCRPVAKMDKLKTWVVSPGEQRVPRTTRGVPLTYVSFERFTRVTPAGAAGPVVVANPVIGPDPLKPAAAAADGRNAGAVVARHKGKATRLTMLLDTGAACSMISVAKAAELGVTYDEDTGTLAGALAKEQFSLSVGGIGGMKTAQGFYLDVLALPAQAGEPIVYAKAPVLVSDVTVTDPATGRPFTLDGVFGMNFLTASASIEGGLLPEIGDIVGGPFEWVVIDHVRGVLSVR